MTGSTADRRTFSKDNSSQLFIYDLLSTGFVPEWITRIGIRQMLSTKLKELRCDDASAETMRFARELETMPIAISTDSANDQHYEVPTEFFELILGPMMKYSCCYWDGCNDLAEAELKMLELTCRRAEIEDGQRILDLGCGWGSFCLYAASKFKKSRITAVSNSRTQKSFIEKRMKILGLENIEIVTADINDLSLPRKAFDRVVSVEMFEHAKNYKLLLQKVSNWLDDSGRLFVHIFAHVEHQYHFGLTEDDWLAKYFFTGGTMPSDSLLSCFRDDLVITDKWKVNGSHYQRTSEWWLKRMGDNRPAIMAILKDTYGREQSIRWWVYWRLFFLACAELWGYGGGNEWIVSHYLFKKRSSGEL